MSVDLGSIITGAYDVGSRWFNRDNELKQQALTWGVDLAGKGLGLL